MSPAVSSPWRQRLFPLAVQRNREARGSGHVVGVDVQLDLEAVGKMPARLVEHHVPAGDQKQPATTLEKKTAGIGQRALLGERTDARSGQQDGIDHQVKGSVER
jgi:hypothetical protein